MIPTSSYQLLILVALVLPGIVFGSTLQRLRGPTPEDKDASTRILRAIAVGAAFDIVYAFLFGPTLVELVKSDSGKPGGVVAAFVSQPRTVALWTLLLAGVIPAIGAYVVYAQGVVRDANDLGCKERLYRIFHGTYRTTPTAWDHISQSMGGCFIRVRLGDGKFVGGWVNHRAYVSGYPEARDIFIASQWALDDRGVFLHKIEGTMGVYVPLPDDVVVEWIAAPPQPADQAKLDEPGSRPVVEGDTQ